MTEASQCNRITTTGQDTKKNIQIGNVQNIKNTIFNIDNYLCTDLLFANLKLKISMCDE